MAYGQFGGGGSVTWEIDVDDGDIPQTTPKNGKPRGYNVKALDKHGKPDTDKSKDYFEIKLDPGAGGSITMKSVGKTVYLYVQIDPKNRDQLKVTWSLKEDQIPKDARSLS